MNKPPAAARLLDLLLTCKGTIESFAARSEKITTDFRVRLARERQRHENALSELTRQAAVQEGEADAAFQAAKAGLTAHYHARAARIGRAYQSSKELMLVRIEDHVGARKYELQKTALQAEKDRERNLAQAAERLNEFQTRLAALQQQLGEVEGRAQTMFGGIGRFRSAFRKAYETVRITPETEEGLLNKLVALLEQSKAEALKLQGNFLLKLFKYWPVWLVLALVPLGLVPFSKQLGLPELSYAQAGGLAGGIFAIFLGIRFALVQAASAHAQALSVALSSARRTHDLALETAEAHYTADVQAAHDQYAVAISTSDQRLKLAVSDAGQKRISVRMQADEKTVRITARNDATYQARLSRIEKDYHGKVQTLRQGVEVRKAALTNALAELQQKLNREQDEVWNGLEREWQEKLQPVWTEMRTAKETADQLFAPWTADSIKKWSPPGAFAHAARIAELKVDCATLCDAMPKDPRLALPGEPTFSIPIALVYPEKGSVVIESSNTGHEEAVGALNNAILRLLTVAPPGRLNFTIIDPVGLGQNFAGIMHLADYEEQLINSRIWTQSGQIEQKLADLNEHMEKVIQMYLRNEYATIAEYNEQAGVIAEKYHFLVVADFPAGFTDVSARRLLSIAASGAKCGVYVLIHWDRRQPLPQDFIPEELRKNALCLHVRGKDFLVAGWALPGTELQLDQPPAPDLAIDLVHRIGQVSRDSSRVEVPFDHVSPSNEEVWTLQTAGELRVPIGRTGATKLQYLAFGKGTCQHGLVAGKTGSGKSTLFHVVVTNLALWCDPNQVEFYLVDFKKGVEFKCYATHHLPHARVVAIESDREFGLSVLQKVDEELHRRGDLFRNLGVQDVPGYKKAGGKERMPRCLLMIDEFQEFFVEDDKIAQTASLLLDRIVRQGRAFGIHVLLGSQTLGGAYTVARTTLGQMVVRIALQCNEADAYLIMDDSNPAPRLLSRPGEGIYNDTAGSIEGNSPFQVVWLSDDVRDARLAQVRSRANQSGVAYPGPIVFEGNVPADIDENFELQGWLQGAAREPAAPRIWLGAPNSIKGPTQAVFQRQSGNNLLIVGQRDEAILGMVTLSVVSLAAQYSHGQAQVILLDASAPGTQARDYLDRLLIQVPQPVKLVRPVDVPEVFAALAALFKERSENPDATHATPVFVIINGLQRFNRLRFEEDFGFGSSDSAAAPSPAATMNTLLTEGTRLGFHIVASCDSYNNVNRYLSRKALSEFEMRVLFQMSANDSASLIENPKASALGLHRALFYNAQEGYLETFRPYALPGAEWLEKAAKQLKQKFSGGNAATVDEPPKSVSA